MSPQEPHYIRCIKPNELKRPQDFDHDLCLHQVRGVYEYDCVSVCVCVCVCVCVQTETLAIQLVPAGHVPACV